MILQLTTTQAELLYRVLGGKKEGLESEIDEGGLIDGLEGGLGKDEGINSGIGEKFPPILTPEDILVKTDILLAIAQARQKEDERAIVLLDKVIRDLEVSGFNELTVQTLKSAKIGAQEHNEKKYSEEFKTKK